MPYGITVNGEEFHSSKFVDSGTTPGTRRSRSYKEKQMNMNIELIKKYSNSPKNRLSKKLSLNSSENNKAILIHKCPKTRGYDDSRVSGGFLFGRMLGRGKFGEVFVA